MRTFLNGMFSLILTSPEPPVSQSSKQYLVLHNKSNSFMPPPITKTVIIVIASTDRVTTAIVCRHHHLPSPFHYDPLLLFSYAVIKFTGTPNHLFLAIHQQQSLAATSDMWHASNTLLTTHQIILPPTIKTNRRITFQCFLS